MGRVRHVTPLLSGVNLMVNMCFQIGMGKLWHIRDLQRDMLK
jgi:hypothetical protein